PLERIRGELRRSRLHERLRGSRQGRARDGRGARGGRGQVGVGRGVPLLQRLLRLGDGEERVVGDAGLLNVGAGEEGQALLRVLRTQAHEAARELGEAGRRRPRVGSGDAPHRVHGGGGGAGARAGDGLAEGLLVRTARLRGHAVRRGGGRGQDDGENEGR